MPFLTSLFTSLFYCACCFLYFALHAPPANAAHQVRWPHGGDQVFQHFGVDKGLPHPIVTSLAEDKDGMLWVGTQGGLARWDGYHFRAYRPDSRQSGSLPDNFIQVLHTDKQGQLWIGSSGAGLARYVREQDNFQSYPVGTQGVSHVSVTSICDDGLGGLWIGTSDGLNHFDPSKPVGQQFQQFHQRDNKGLPDSNILSLLLLKEGGLLVGTGKGLARLSAGWRTGAVRFTTYAFPGLNEKSPAVQSMLQASNGVVWMGTARQGVFLLQGKTLEPLHQSVAAAVGWANEFVVSIAEVNKNQIWMGTYGQGLLQVDLESGAVQRIKRDPMLAHSLADDTIWCVLRGRGDFLWIGGQRGLQLHDVGQHAVLSLFGVQKRANGLTDPDVFSVLSMDDGSIWLGLGSNGIDIVDPREENVRGIRPQPSLGTRGLPAQPIYALTAHQQYVYAGSSLGLFRVQRSSLEVQKMANGNDAVTGDVRAIALSGAMLWSAGFQGGLWWRPLAAKAETPPTRPPGTELLSDQRITVLEPTGDGKMWVGTRNGLNLLDPVKGTVEQIKANPVSNTGLSGGLIMSLLQDRQGRLWVGTLGGGISVLTGRDAKGQARFQQIGPMQGLQQSNIAKILQDEQGMIWASTDSGLVQIDPTSFRVRPLLAAEGVPVAEYWANSGTKDSAGEIIFGGTGGMTLVRPQLFREWHFKPTIVITEARVMGKLIPALHFNQAYQTNPAQELVLQPGRHHLALEFAALDYSAPERLRYMYRMEGYDRDWIETDSLRRLAAYTNLPPGRYQLHLRGSNRSGVFAEQDLVLPILVVPAWYETWWFSLLQLLALLAAIMLLLRLSTRYLRLRQRDLENQVFQRTAQLQEKQNQLLAAIGGLNRANEDLALSADTLRQLGDVGRDITANLDAQKVFEALHLHVGNLLDASTLVIYRSDAAEKCLTRCFGREDGKALPQIEIELDSPTSHTARAVRERREILLERNVNEGQPWIGGKRIMLTSLFAPLIIDTKVLGVMAIQSERPHAYGERERMIFRTLCGYGAIALANAEVLAALHSAQTQLVQQEKLASLGGLVTGVAHEINTPLGVTILALSGIKHAWQSLENMLQGPLAAMLKSSPREVVQQTQDALSDGNSYTEMALHNANRAAALITSFQAITAHFESDTLDTLDLATYLPEVAALFQTDFASHGHVLEINVAPGLQVQTVAAALTEALSRILANVQDHAFAEGQAGNVRLFARRGIDDWIEISVQDDGNGIATSALPKVFDPFFSGPEAGSGHVGLGLHVAYNHVALRLKGRILIDSTPQYGTTVTIRLPRNYPGEGE